MGASESILIPLRDYQQRAHTAVFKEWEEVCATLVVKPTGTGKTVLFASIINSVQPKRALVVAHREELIFQARDTITKFTGLECGIEMADRYVNNSLFGDTPVVISTVQTQNSGRGDRKRMSRFDPKEFGVLIIDEAHRATGQSYRDLINFYKTQNPEIKILGVTATPDRADEEALGGIFESVAFDYEILDAIHDGWLVPIDQQFVQTTIDWSGIRTTCGDLNGADLAAVMEAESSLQEVAGATIDIIGNRRTLIFTASVKQAEVLSNILNRHRSGMADWVCGATNKDRRREMLARYNNGDTQVMVNCNCLSEGFDSPGVEVVVQARPTKSRCLYAQQCLDKDTQVLTKNGWRGHADIKEDDLVAAMDEMTEVVSFVPIEESVLRPIEKGEYMMGISSPVLDIRVTNRHDMLVSMSVGKMRKQTGWFKIEADCIRSPFRIPCAGKPLYQDVGLPLTDDEIKFIGWVLTDGSINKITGQIAITQGEHQPWIGEIEKCLIGCGFKFGKSTYSRKTQYNQTSKCVRWTVSKGSPRGRDSHLRGWGALAAYLDKEISTALFSLSARQFSVLLEAIHLGDGSKYANVEWVRRSYHITSARIKFVDRLQALCVMNGWSCNVIELDWNKSPLWMIHINPVNWRSVLVTSADSRPVWSKLHSEPDELVWCLTNELGTLVTRRNGKVAIVGNCGRSMRPLPGIVDGPPDAESRMAAIAASAKPSCLIVDFVGNSGKHKLMSSADILGGKVSDDALERAVKRAEKLGKPVRMSELLDEEEDNVREEAEERRQREEARKARLVAKVKYSARAINPFDVFEIEPVKERGWDNGRTLTEKQRGLLLKQGIDPDSMSYAHGRQMLNEMFRRWGGKLATLKQCSLLKKHGYETKDMTMDHASKLIDGLAKNNWKRPDKPFNAITIPNEVDNVPF